MTARGIRVGSSGRRRRLGTTPSGRRSTRAADPITVDLDLCFSSPGCIDLTDAGDDCDDDDDAEVVAFNSYTDDSVICLGEHNNSRSTGYASRRTRPSRNRASSRSPVVIDRVELPSVLDNQQVLPIVYNSEPVVEIPVIKVSDTEEPENHLPPRTKEIICPICLDEHSTLASINKQLVSTICGHLFCNECIKTAIRNSKCCPTCRKRLTVKQFHPIFL